MADFGDFSFGFDAEEEERKRREQQSGGNIFDALNPASGAPGMTPSSPMPGLASPTLPGFSAGPSAPGTPQPPKLEHSFYDQRQGQSGWNNDVERAGGPGGTAPMAPPERKVFKTQGAAGAGVAAMPGAAARYKDSVTKLQATTDPQQRAVLQDQLGRQLYTEFKSAGHDVKWDGPSRLIVDGRPYDIAGANTSALARQGIQGAPRPVSKMGQPSAALPSSLAYADPNNPNHISTQSVDRPALSMSYGDDMGTPNEMPGMSDPETQPGGMPPATMPRPTGAGGNTWGTPAEKWGDPNHQTPKYVVMRQFSDVIDQLRAIPDEAGRKAFAQQQLEALKPMLEADGARVLEIRNEKILIDNNDGKGPLWMDAIEDIEGKANPQWIEPGGGDVEAGGGVGLGRGATADGPGSAWQQPGAEGASGVQTNGWQPSAPGYQPGEIPMDDLPAFSYDSLFRDAGGDFRLDPTQMEFEGNAGGVGYDYAAPDFLPGMDYQAGSVEGSDYQEGRVSNDPLEVYRFNGWGELPELAGRGSALDQSTEALAGDIVDNPMSLDPHTLEMLKARSKDELAERYQMEDEDLRRTATSMGIEDSRWLASERMAATRDRDRTLNDTYRNLDIEAAKTNFADKQDAARLGTDVGNTLAQRNLAERGQVFGEEATGEEMKQAAVLSFERAKRFGREGELANEALRAEGLDKRYRSQLTNEELRGDATDKQFRAASTVEDLRQTAASGRTGAQTTNAQLAEAGAGRRQQGQLSLADLNQRGALGSAELRQSAAQIASSASLQKFAAAGDRMALRESTKQEATRLGITQDEVMSRYTIGVMDDLRQKYGIDVGAQIDREKLAQASSEFKQDLMFRITSLQEQMKLEYARLAESARGKNLDYGLGVAGLQNQRDIAGWDAYAGLFE